MKVLFGLALLMPVVCQASEPATDGPEPAARDILKTFVDAWRGREEMKLGRAVVLNIGVEGDGGGRYQVRLSDSDAVLHEGHAADWDVAFNTDLETLRTIDNPLNVNTALGAARAGDWTPLERDIPDDVEWTEKHASFVRRLTFHFWNREWPEVVRFGPEAARRLHGADASLIYYEKGLRLGWFHVGPGMHVNADPRDQVNPFPTWVVVTDGKMRAKIDGSELSLESGQAVLVPEGKAHEFWAREDDSGASGVIIMFGEGA